MVQLQDLDSAFGFTGIGNNYILKDWLVVSIRNQYRPAYERLEWYLMTIGRMKYIAPLYKELIKTDEGRELAKQIFEAAQPGYHPLTTAAINRLFVQQDKT